MAFSVKLFKRRFWEHPGKYCYYVDSTFPNGIRVADARKKKGVLQFRTISVNPDTPVWITAAKAYALDWR